MVVELVGKDINCGGDWLVKRRGGGEDVALVLWDYVGGEDGQRSCLTRVDLG